MSKMRDSVVASTSSEKEANQAISALQAARVPFRVERFRGRFWFHSSRPRTFQETLILSGIRLRNPGLSKDEAALRKLYAEGFSPEWEGTSVRARDEARKRLAKGKLWEMRSVRLTNHYEIWIRRKGGRNPLAEALVYGAGFGAGYHAVTKAMEKNPRKRR